MKNIKKQLCFLFLGLSVSLYAANWDGSTSEPKNTKEIDGKTFYVITAAEELAWFAEKVNGGEQEINAVLANDILFMDDTSKTSEVNWTPIGKNFSVRFKGVFDGAGQTIYGLYCKQDTHAGIFGATDSIAVIKNVKSRNSVINSNAIAGGIVAECFGKVLDCMNSGSVSSYVSGGIVGLLSYGNGIVKGCTNYGSVSSVGSIPISGGIVGHNNEGTVSICVNSGTVTSSRVNSTGSGSSGGIVGNNSGMVKDCKNTGRAFGGLVTTLEYVPRDTVSQISNSFSVTDSATAGVVVEVQDDRSLVINCYYDSDVLQGLSTESPNTGLHTSEMQSDSFAWILNTTNGDSAHSGVWSRGSEGYPIFADSLHLPIYKVVFDDSGATTDRYTNYKGLVAFPENPEPPAGKKFSGWFTNDEVKVGESTVFTKDQTVYAVYCDSSSCPTEPPDAIIANLPSPAWSVTASGRNFLVHAAPVGKPYALFDLQGKVLAKGRVESPEMTLSAPRAGSYIVRVGEHSVRMNAR